MLAHAHEHTLCTGQRLSYELLVVHDELDRDVVEPVDHGPNPVVDVGILSDFERKTNRIYVCSRARSLPSLDPRPLTTSTSPIPSAARREAPLVLVLPIVAVVAAAVHALDTRLTRAVCLEHRRHGARSERLSSGAGGGGVGLLGGKSDRMVSKNL